MASMRENIILSKVVAICNVSGFSNLSQHFLKSDKVLINYFQNKLTRYIRILDQETEFVQKTYL